MAECGKKILQLRLRYSSSSLVREEPITGSLSPLRKPLDNLTGSQNEYRDYCGYFPPIVQEFDISEIAKWLFLNFPMNACFLPCLAFSHWCGFNPFIGEAEIERRMLDLSTTENRLRFIVRAAGMGVWTLDLATKRLIASDHCKAHLAAHRRTHCLTRTWSNPFICLIAQDGGWKSKVPSPGMASS